MKILAKKETRQEATNKPPPKKKKKLWVNKWTKSSQRMIC